MSEQSAVLDLVALARATLEAADRRDFDAVMTFHAEDAVWDASSTGVGVFDGLPAVRGFLEDWYGAFAQWRGEPEEMLDVGDGVVFALIRWDGRPVGSDSSTSVRGALVFQFAAAMIVRVTVYTRAGIEQARAEAERLAQAKGGHVETVKLGIAAYNRRDIDAVYELATPDFEWVPALVVMIEGASVRGRDGMERYFREIGETWEEYSLVIDEFRDLGERVLAFGRIEARGLGSGVQVDTPWGAVFEFRGERMSHAHAYLDYREVLRAAGISE